MGNQKRKQTDGECLYCGKTYKKGGMTRHIKACKARAAWNEKQVSKPQKLYHIQVQGMYATDYWMHIEVDGKRTLGDLDQFLRNTWLECCGHMSRFELGAQSYASYPMPEFDERDMQVRMDKVLKPDVEFLHEYDYGTTTELTLKVIGVREGELKTDGWLDVISQNNPPELTCEVCKQKPATEVCTFCIWGGEVAFLCETCKPKHQCVIEEDDEYMLLPVVNSPRMGMCGYEG